MTKVPRFTFEKFPQAADRLTTQMKSVGEVMAIGRTFQESLQKALRGLEIGTDGLNPVMKSVETEDDWAKLKHELKHGRQPPALVRRRRVSPRPELEEVGELTAIDPWFLAQIKELIDIEKQVVGDGPGGVDAEELRKLKRRGFSDRRIADLIGVKEKIVRTARHKENIRPVFKRVDSCAAEFASNTAYLYSTYEEFCEADPTDRQKIMILGGGPNRIGQGIEFDYCCVHASFALKEAGLRDHHGQLQPGDGVDGLRHVRPAVLRARHARGRARDRAQGKAEGRHRAVRRPDAAEARARARGSRRADHRHVAGLDRSRRGPRALPAARQSA